MIWDHKASWWDNVTINLVLRFPTAKGKGDLTFQRKTEWDLGTRLRDSQQTVRTTSAAVFQTHKNYFELAGVSSYRGFELPRVKLQ